MNTKKICFVSARPSSAFGFLGSQMRRLSDNYEVHLAANFDEYKTDEPEQFPMIICHNVNIRRNISLFYDLRALLQLIKVFRNEHFICVQSITPKAGLLSMLGAFLSRTRIRMHVFTGQVWATKSGAFRWLLKTMDCVTAACATNILVDGNGQRNFLIKEKVVSADKSKVLANGSIAGVPVDKFKFAQKNRTDIRHKYSITDDKTVYVFMGRLNRDKGIHELYSAFNRLAGIHSDVLLLLFGRDEDNCDLTVDKYENIHKGNNYIYPGVTDEPQTAMQAGDIFVLPTYREGFGSSVIEASCLGLPVICSDAYGVMDAMVEEETGLRCKVGDVDSLFECMERLYQDRQLRERLGTNGHKRVVEQFAGEIVTEAWVKYYDEKLK